MSWRARRGSHGVMLAVSVVALLGFGAFAVDIAWLLQARDQADATADATALAALHAARRDGTTTAGDAMAATAAARNAIAGAAPDAPTITWGTWDDTAPTPAFTALGTPPNAVEITVGRTGANAVPLLLATLWGGTDRGISATAIAAARSVQVVFVVDIDEAWGETDFGHARTALRDALARLGATASPVDEVALVVHDSRYAWLWSPLTTLSTSGAVATLDASWAKLNLSSRAGSNASPIDGFDCTVHVGPSTDNFTTPAGGCYPDSPRAYSDETGTDHAVGLQLAADTLSASPLSVARRAVVVLSGHPPAGTPAAAGAARAADGFVETRFTELAGPVPRSAADVATAADTAATTLLTTLGAHLWVVSTGVADPMYDTLPRGDGAHRPAAAATDLPALLAGVVAELPIAVVQ